MTAKVADDLRKKARWLLTFEMHLYIQSNPMGQGPGPDFDGRPGAMSHLMPAPAQENQDRKFSRQSILKYKMTDALHAFVHGQDLTPAFDISGF